MTRAWVLWAGSLLLALAWFGPTPASAQSCSFSVSDMNFGSVDTLSGGASGSTATVSANCSGLSLQRILICPYLGAGGGGATGGSRQMTGPASLNYQLYSDGGYSTVWGSYTAPFATGAPPIVVNLNTLGTGTGSATMYGAVLANQSAALPGSYTSVFSGAEVEFRYAYSLLSSCTGLLSVVARPSFTVRATVPTNCLVTTTSVDFGSKGFLSANVDADGQVSVNCTPNAAYTVGLGNGLTGTAPASRRMTLGAQSVTYGLYKNAARSQVWGDAATPGSTVSGTGSGAATAFPVYGRVPPQATPSPGTYSDTVVVTVTY